MYLQKLKGAVVESLRATFDVDYPNAHFQDLWASIEFPIEQTNYPGLWVTYDDTDELSIAGVDHEEELIDELNDTITRWTRWRFKGIISITVVAMTSWERDQLFDEVVRTFISAKYNEEHAFRKQIEDNDWIALQINFDDLRPAGDAAAQGTPWGTEDVIYEKTISMTCLGEFLSDKATTELLRLSAVIPMPYVLNTPEPPFTGVDPDNPEVLDPGIPGYPDTFDRDDLENVQRGYKSDGEWSGWV